MQAGREMDALVAERVMGWHENAYHYWSDSGWAVERTTDTVQANAQVWSPSTDIAAAWEVVEKVGVIVVPVRDVIDKFPELDELGPIIAWVADADAMRPHEYAHWFERDSYDWTKADTAPLAICRAALKCVEDKP